MSDYQQLYVPDLSCRKLYVYSDLLISVSFLLLSACTSDIPPAMLGTLEWDRVSVMAEASEPILHIAVSEGDAVHAGDLILELDPRRTEAGSAQAQAEVRRLEAQLAELRHGARIETIDAARATLAKAESTATNAKRERDRQKQLRQRGLNAQGNLDQAETLLKTSVADANAARANLAQLTNGSRIEDIDQAEAALAAAQAHLRLLELTRERLSVRAPRDGKIDALPFKLGDQPPIGVVVVSLLSGVSPYARIYVPAHRRSALTIGARCRIHVEGTTSPYSAILRSVRSDPAFTPYYALSGDDASRLAYRAELVLEGQAAKQLPAGLPVRVECPAHGG